jgi:peptidoglycan/LPS O-acetylase OafA/YrhL
LAGGGAHINGGTTGGDGSASLVMVEWFSPRPRWISSVTQFSGWARRYSNNNMNQQMKNPTEQNAIVSRGKLETIQAMRGIAAMLVVFWHASRYFGPYGTGWAGALFFPGANLGVDLFFLISGFIMVVTTRGSDGSSAYAAEFMIKRFARVWPPYAIAAILLVALIPERFSLYVGPGGAARFLQGVLFIPAPIANTEAPAFGFPPLPVGWTLNYEMYFYVIFAVSLLFGRGRWLAFSAWIGITLFAIPYFLSPTGISIVPSVDYGFDTYLALVTNPIILLFAGGVLIGLAYNSRLQINNVFTLNLAVFLAISLTVFQYSTAFRVEHGVSKWGLSLIPLLLTVTLATKTINIHVPRIVAYLGDISFSLYIFHPLTQEGFDHVALRAGCAVPSGFSAFFFTTVLAIMAAALSHRYLELGLARVVRTLLEAGLRGLGTRIGAVWKAIGIYVAQSRDLEAI